MPAPTPATATAPIPPTATATATATATDANTRASRETQMDRAWALHCEGHKAPAIAERLHVAQRTVRSWIARITSDLAADRDATRAQRHALAIERHLGVAAAAWDAFHRAEDLDRAALEDYQAARRAHERAAAAKVPTPEDCGVDRTLLDPNLFAEAWEAANTPPPPPRQPKLAASGARYLTLALQAHRAVARLEGHHNYVPEPDKPLNDHLILAPPEHMTIPEEDVHAWRAFRRHYYANGGVPLMSEDAVLAVERLGDELNRGVLRAEIDPFPAGDDEAPREKSAESAIAAEDHTEPLDPGSPALCAADTLGLAPLASPGDAREKSAESAESAESMAQSAHRRAAAIAASLTPPPSPKRHCPADFDRGSLAPLPWPSPEPSDDQESSLGPPAGP